MPTTVRTVSVILLLISWAVASCGQTKARLQTSETDVSFEERSASPLIISLAVPGQKQWTNRSSEVLIPFVEIAGKQVPCSWTYNREASQIDERRVAFIYDSASPHLRLTWEWRAPQTYGPIEHQIRIQNLESSEIWIPMQDSLAFDWQIDPQASLERLYVEKGANTPSAVGTHHVLISDGYRWTGTSSAYGDLGDEPREIIPWSLVQRMD